MSTISYIYAFANDTNMLSAEVSAYKNSEETKQREILFTNKEEKKQEPVTEPPSGKEKETEKKETEKKETETEKKKTEEKETETEKHKAAGHGTAGNSMSGSGTAGSGSAGGGSIPGTGDDSDMRAEIVAMLCSIVVICGIYLRRKKRSKERSHEN